MCFGAQAEHIIASLTKGTRDRGRHFRTRTWTTGDGQERSMLEVLAEEIGPSLALGHHPGHPVDCR